jgi:surface polysaccharide O-acyltransferase-like enzyme
VGNTVTKRERERESSFELLRIIAMIMIVLTHLSGTLYNNPHSAIANLEDVHGETQGYIIYLIACFGNIGNTVFFMISGYFIAKQKSTKPFRLYKVLLPSIFYAFAFLVFDILLKIDISPAFSDPITMLKYFFTTDMWYTQGYIILVLLLAPLIRPILKLKLKLMILLIVSIEIVALFLQHYAIANIGFIYSIYWGVPGVSVFLKVILYLPYVLLGMTSLTNRDQIINKIIHLRLSFLTSFFILSSVVFVLKADLSMASEISMLFGAFLFFCFFRLNIKSYAINKIAESVFGIYILHDAALSPICIYTIGSNSLVRPFINENPQLWPLIFVFAPIIFVVCMFIEFIRTKCVSLMSLIITRVIATLK